MPLPLPNADLPQRIADEAALEELLSRPTPAVVDVFARLDGGVAVLGSGGKMGLSLVAMACRARDAVATGGGGGRTIYSVSRFGDAAARAAHERAGAVTVACDLMDRDAAMRALPDAANVVYMVGLKFGTGDNPAMTWAANTVAPLHAAERYRDARIVAFSTGCVYDLSEVGAGSVETDPLEPRGEYANACVARERIFQYMSQRHGTRIALVRLNYALEPRYGVLVDLAQTIARGEPVDVTMGWFNGIWQGDANAAALRLLEHAAAPPLAINVTGLQTLRVRDVATRLGERMNAPVYFTGEEAPTALLSNASRMRGMLGEPGVPIDRVIDWVADWVSRGGETLGKPTHFQTRDGRY
jgi:nucleoside-diphosphate-sugar epimerase